MDKAKKEADLVTLRKEVGITQRDMADQLGVTIQTIRNWEQGKTVPLLSIPKMKILCRLLQRRLEDMPDTFAPGAEESSDRPARNQLTLL